MFEGLKSFRRERADAEIGRVVIGSMLEDTEINDIIFGDVDGIKAYNEATSTDDADDADLEKLIDEIPESDDSGLMSALIDAEDDIDIDELLGVKE